MIDGPFDIRKYNYTLKPENRSVPAVGSTITGVTLESASFKSLVDGSGLGNNDSDRLVEHSTNEADMWIGQSDAVGKGIVFDLPEERMLESIAVWNYNKPAYTDMGIQKCDIAVWTADGGWKTILKNAELREAEGTGDYDEPTILTVDPVAAAKVRFENPAAFNPKAGKVGLSEVAFYEPLGPAACNPEPTEGAKVSCNDDLLLMWTGGRNAVAHDVYAGQSNNGLTLLGRIKGVPQVKVAGLSADTDYVWRIDEVAKDGTVTQGPIWSLKVCGQQVARWKLDGTADDTVGQFSGTVQGEPTWQAGHDGQALQLNGQSDYVEIPALNLNTDMMTICAWINVGEPTPAKAGVVFARAGQTTAGINIREGNLRYHWNNVPETYSWNSGLTIPTDQWVFVALTVQPNKGTLYLYDGSELKSAENPILHTAEEFDGPLCIGRDSGFNDRYFKGLVDDVQLFDFPLSAVQIKTIAQGQDVDLSGQAPVRLVDADLLHAGQSLADIAAEAEKGEAAEKTKGSNLLVVLAIVLVVVVLGVFSVTRKKK